MREPPFWWRDPGLASAALGPLAAAYGAVAAARLAREGYRPAVPVVCIGNLTVGGAGKTPAALAVARLLNAAGEEPVLLSRGYRGRLAGPVRVNLWDHTAADVGDEALLLARMAPTIVARDRVAGAQAAVAAGATVIVMDDGFQNPSLHKDLSILVVDARRGVGNGCVIPAGPLRAPLAAQVARAEALLAIGEGSLAPAVARAVRESRRPVRVFSGQLVPSADTVAQLQDIPVLAFAGIGDPEKFFATLRAAGIAAADTVAFDDHHRLTAAEAQALRVRADRDGLTLLTTEKDLARMAGDPALADLARRVRVLPVALALEDDDGFGTFLLTGLAAARAAVG